MIGLRAYQLSAIKANMSESKRIPAQRLSFSEMESGMQTFMTRLQACVHVDVPELHAWMAERRHELAHAYIKALHEDAGAIENFIEYARRQYLRAHGKAI